MNKYLITICLLASLASSCSALKTAPDETIDRVWLAEQKAQYPVQSYYHGYGSGDSLVAAVQQANKQLAQQITGNPGSIKASTEDGNNTVDPEKLQLWTQKVDLINKIISIIDEEHLSANSHKTVRGKQQVVVFVKRSTLAQTLRDRIIGLDQKSKDLFTKAGSTYDAMEQIAAAHQMVKTLVVRYYLNEIQQKTDPSADVVTAPFDLSTFIAGYENLLRSVVIIANTGDPQITQVLQKSIKEAGFNLNPLTNRIPYILESRLQSDTTADSGKYSLQGELEIALKRGNKHGPVIGSAQWALKVSAESEAELSAELVKQITQISKANLQDTIVEIALANAQNKD